MASSNGKFHLDSPAFHNGDLIPAIHAADSLNLSPPLRWAGAPTGTSSFSLIVDDPDVPAGPWVHWVLFNIPADQRSLTAAQPQSLQLSNGHAMAAAGESTAISALVIKVRSRPMGSCTVMSFRSLPSIPICPCQQAARCRPCGQPCSPMCSRKPA